MTASTSAALELFHLAQDYWLLGIIVLFCCRILYNRYQLGLDKAAPGPFSRTISSVPRLLSVYRGFSHEDDMNLHRKYGSLVRLAPNLISVSDPAAINAIYGIGTKFFKGPFYSLVAAYDEEGVLPDPFILTDRQLHTRVKRSAANAYSLNTLVQLEPYLDGVTERLVKKLEGFARDGKAVDIAPLMQAYAMDAVTALTFGKDFNHMDAGDHLGLFYATKLINDYMAILGQIPWVHKYLFANPWIAEYFAGAEGNMKMVNMAKEEMEADRKGTNLDVNGPMTFLQRLLANQANNPSSLTDRELITHCFGNIAAGSDTTAIAIRSVLYYTLRDDTVRNRLQTEIREALPADDLSSVRFAAVNALPYLGAVIKEGIRLHPSVGMMLVRVVPEGGATLCGRAIPAGAQVGVNPWILHRDPEVFDDPDTFRPERWLDEKTEPERLKLMNRSWIPFGHGAHTCSGRWISWMEIHKMVATLFLVFDMELADGGKDLSFTNLWFTSQTGLRVSFRRASR